ncbi:MAG: hypothetical protein LBD97_10470 [Bifidobacteriaceae bacterium]|nr:hypothetical protein [Bifidobacteriaceae bacterium]
MRVSRPRRRSAWDARSADDLGQDRSAARLAAEGGDFDRISDLVATYSQELGTVVELTADAVLSRPPG